MKYVCKFCGYFTHFEHLMVHHLQTEHASSLTEHSSDNTLKDSLLTYLLVDGLTKNADDSSSDIDSSSSDIINTPVPDNSFVGGGGDFGGGGASEGFSGPDIPDTSSSIDSGSSDSSSSCDSGRGSGDF